MDKQAIYAKYGVKPDVDSDAVEAPVTTSATPRSYGQEDFSNAVSMGYSSFKQGLASIPAALGSTSAQKFIDDESIRQQLTSQRIENAQSFEEVQQRGLGALPGYIQHLAGSSTPEMLSLIATGGAGGLVARGLGAAVSRGVTAGTVAGAFPSGTGQALQTQYEQTGRYDLPKAALGGALYAGLTLAGPLEMAAAKLALPKITVNSAADIMEATGATIVKEAAQEAAQDEVVGNLQAEFVSPDFEYLGEEANKNRLEAAVGGALLGGTIGGAAATGKYLLGRGEQNLLEDKSATDAEVTPKQELYAPNMAPNDGPKPEYVPTPIASEDLSGQTSFLPGFNRPDYGTVMQPQDAPEEPFVDTRTADMFTPENRLDVAQRNFGRQGAGRSTVDQINDVTGVNNVPEPFSAGGMARRLNEQVFDIEGNPIGTMGDLYAQIAQEQNPERPSGDPGVRATSGAGNRDMFTGKVYAPGATQQAQPGTEVAAPTSDLNQSDMFAAERTELAKVTQFLTENKLTPKSEAYRNARKVGTLAGLPGVLRRAADKANDKELAIIEAAYQSLTGRTLDDVVEAEPAEIVPENQKDIDAQAREIALGKTAKKTMLVTPGSPMPTTIPEGASVIKTRQGTFITTDPTAAAFLQLKADTLTTDQAGEQLGYIGRKADSDGTVIRALDSDGAVIWEQATNEADLEDVVKVAQTMVPEGGRIEATTVDKVLAQRETEKNAKASAPKPRKSATVAGDQAPTNDGGVQQTAGESPKGRSAKRPVGSASTKRAAPANGESVPAVPASADQQPALEAAKKAAPKPESTEPKPSPKTADARERKIAEKGQNLQKLKRMKLSDLEKLVLSKDFDALDEELREVVINRVVKLDKKGISAAAKKAREVQAQAEAIIEEAKAARDAALKEADNLTITPEERRASAPGVSSIKNATLAKLEEIILAEDFGARNEDFRAAVIKRLIKLDPKGASAGGRKAKNLRAEEESSVKSADEAFLAFVEEKGLTYTDKDGAVSPLTIEVFQEASSGAFYDFMVNGTWSVQEAVTRYYRYLGVRANEVRRLFGASYEAEGKKPLVDEGMSTAETDILEEAAAKLDDKSLETLQKHAKKVGAKQFTKDLINVANGFIQNLTDAVVMAMRALLFAINAMSVNLGNIDAVKGYIELAQPDQAPRTEVVAEAMGKEEGRPFLVINKKAATIKAYNEKGELVGSAPVLLGQGKGDVLPDTTKRPGLLNADEKITPAGKFTGVMVKDENYGTAIVLPGTATPVKMEESPVGWGLSTVAVHRPFKASPTDTKRADALKSDTVADNRVTQGCLSPSDKFYDEVVQPLFAKSNGTVFILPEQDIVESSESTVLSAPLTLGLAMKAVRAVRRQRRQAEKTTVASIQYQRATLGDASPGMASSNEISPPIRDMAGRLATLLGLNQNITILSAKDIESGKMLDELSASDYAREKLEIAVSKGVNGAAISDPDSNRVFIYMNTGRTIGQQIETIAHEIGHVVENTELAAAPKDMLDAMKQSHAAWVERSKGMKVEDFLRSLRNRETAISAVRLLGDDVKGTMAKDIEQKDRDEYWMSFSEWFADNVSKWATTNKIPPKKVERFFARLARKLRAILEYLQGRDYLPDQTVAQFLGNMMQRPMGSGPRGPGPRGVFYQNDSMAANPMGASSQVGASVRAGRDGMNALIKAAAELPITRTSVSKANRLVQYGMTVGQLVQSYGERLPALVNVNNLRLAMEKMVNDFNLAARDLHLDLKRLTKDRETYLEATRLVFKSTETGFRLDEDITSEGNSKTMAASEQSLSPKDRASFEARRRQAREAVNDEFEPQIQSLIDERNAKLDEAPRGTRTDIRKDYDARVKEVRAAKRAEMAKVTERFNKELAEATQEQRAARAAEYNELKAAFDKLPAAVQRTYKDLFDHYQNMRQREFEVLVTNTMRAMALEDRPTELTEKLNEIDTLQMEISRTRDSAKRATMRDELRDKIRELRNRTIAERLTERSAIIDEHRRTYDGAGHAYVPLMRFGRYVVTGKSKAYNDAEAALEAAKAELKKLEGKDPALAKVTRLEAEVDNLASELYAKEGDERIAAVNKLREARTELKVAKKALNAKVKGEDGQLKPTDLQAARANVAQLQYELTQLRRSGDDYTVNFFESELAAERAVDVLKETGVEVEKHLREQYERSLDAVGASLVAKATANADTAAEREAANILTRLYLQSLPESNALKRRLNREGIQGYSNNLLRVFEDSNRSHAFYVSRLEYADQISGAMGQLREQARATGAEEESVYEMMRGHQVASMTPSNTPLTDAMTRVGALWYLGLTPAFVALNMTQNFLVTWPQLIARYGIADGSKMMYRAMGDMIKLYRTQIKEVKGREVLDFELDFRNAGLNKGESAMIEFLQARGLINFTQTVEMADRRTGGELDSAKGRAMALAYAFERMSWFLPHHTEVFNRGSAALTAYRLAMKDDKIREKAKAKLGGSPSKAELDAEVQAMAQEYAANIVESTHGDYAESNKPLMFRQINRIPLGKLMTLFKSYQQMMVFGLAYNLRTALKKGLKDEEGAIAARAFASTMMAHGVIAGGMGIPAFGAVAFVLDSVFGDDDDPWDTEAEFRIAMSDMFGKAGGEIVSKGVLRALPVIGEWDFSSRVGAGNILSPFMFGGDPRDEGRDKLSAIMLSMSGPVGGIAANAFDAQALMEKGGDMDKVAALLMPKAFADVFKAMSLASGGAQTRSGNTLYEPDFVEITGQLLGFRPSRSAESGEMRRAAFERDTALNRRETYLKNIYAKAFKERDYEGMRAAEVAAREFFRENPKRGKVGELREYARRKGQEQKRYSGGIRTSRDTQLDQYASFGNFEE